MYLLIIPNVPIGRIICISLYPDDPIGRTTKSHEEVVSRVISTLVNIILSCLCPPREVGQSVLVGPTCWSELSSEQKNINRSEALLISTHSHSFVYHIRER